MFVWFSVFIFSLSPSKEHTWGHEVKDIDPHVRKEGRKEASSAGCGFKDSTRWGGCVMCHSNVANIFHKALPPFYCFWTLQLLWLCYTSHSSNNVAARWAGVRLNSGKQVISHCRWGEEFEGQDKMSHNMYCCGKIHFKAFKKVLQGSNKNKCHKMFSKSNLCPWSLIIPLKACCLPQIHVSESRQL